MLEQTNRISFRISSVLSKVEPDLHSGSDQNVPAPTCSSSATLSATLLLRLGVLVPLTPLFGGSEEILKDILSVRFNID